jgi:hypothetical protein
MKVYPETPLRIPCSWPPWPWFSCEKSLNIFKVSFKKYETLTLTLKTVSCKKVNLKSSHWSCLKAWFKDYTFCFTKFFVRPSSGAQQSHERTPKSVQMTLKDQSFVNKFKFLFVHGCTLSVIAYYTQPGLVYYTQPGVRILRLLQNKWTRILLVHSYIDRRYVFFSPLCLLALYQHNQCKFVLEVDDKKLFLFFEKLVLIDFTLFLKFSF